MHSREGFLPGVRFHLEDPRLSTKGLLPDEEVEAHRSENDGFVSLDFLFEHDFKLRFKENEPEFFIRIKGLSLEQFVEMMMEEREQTDPFTFFKREYADALESIRNQDSILWKEKLAILSFALNRPAKYLSAEDTLRLQTVLMPLISVVIAFAPQRSCEELIALHDAGRLELMTVGEKSRVEPRPGGGVEYIYEEGTTGERRESFPTFIDCVGQRHLSYDQFPFQSLKRDGTVSKALVKFLSREEAESLLAQGSETVLLGDDGCYLQVPGVAIGESFEAVGRGGEESDRIFVMAVPLMGGHNPDYSGLDFCDDAAKRIVSKMFADSRLN